MAIARKKNIFILVLSGILVVLINVALVITTLKVRIPPLSFVMYCEKPTKVASTTISSVVRILPSPFNENGEKLKSSKDWILRGDNHKILFFVTSLNMSKFLSKEMLKFLDDEFDPTFIAIMDTCNV